MLAILPDSVNVGDGIFVLSNDEVNRLNLPNNEHTLLRPYYDTKNIRRYYFDTENKYQIIYTTSDFKNASMMDDYPILKKHLDFYAKVITSDNKPYGLHRARQSEFFDNPSIASLRKCSAPTFAYLNKQAYLTAEWYLIKTKRLNMVYLTCLFNSSLVKFWLLKMGKMQGNIFQIDKEPLLNIPIVSPSSSGESEIIELHNKLTSMMLANNNSIIVDIEKRIDEIIYKEYELSDNDIAVIKDELMAWGNQKGDNKMSIVKFEIKHHIGVLSKSAKGWRKELNLISWNGRDPKYDIRDWSPEHEKMGKGTTLSSDEVENLYALLKNIMETHD